MVKEKDCNCRCHSGGDLTHCVPCCEPADLLAEAITAAHPLKTKRHDLYEIALDMVGQRHEKAELVMLVNYLLAENDTLRTNQGKQVLDYWPDGFEQLG